MKEFHTQWRRMMDRCYNLNHSTYKHYGATGAFVCAEWHDYLTYRAWVLTQDHIGKELDKDILIQGNLEYSPMHCRFVDKAVNRLLTTRAASRGELPLGVSQVSRSSRYRGQLNKDGQKIHLGTCDAPLEAHKLWQDAKAKHIEEVAATQNDSVIREALLDRAGKLRVDLRDGTQTLEL